MEAFIPVVAFRYALRAQKLQPTLYKKILKSNAIKSISKYTITTAIAILFHAIGFFGMLLFNRDFFIATTPFHLLLMCALLFYTQQKIDRSFIILFIACFIVGILVEIIGTSTGLLFGNYKYGNALGAGIKNVPLLIGINWFIIIYCCGISIQTLFNRLAQKVGAENINQSPLIKALSVIVDGATLAVIFDFLLEPAAIKLGYWQWMGSGDVPWFNYICWFFISAGLLTIFQFSTFNKQNKFAVNLLLIQALFFLLVRTFL